jgi:hypothetical protein
MRLKKLTGLIVAGALTLGVFGVAAARTGGVLGPKANLFGAPAAAIEAPREVDLPPEQQLSLSHQYISRMDQATTTVRTALEQARAARDVVKTLCLNDKLNQIDVAVRSGKDRAAALQSAVNGRDKDRARHEFMILQVLKDRIDQLVKEANQCIGEEAGFIGESQVSLQVDPNIPDNNTDVLGSDPEIISEPPVLASPPQ